MLELGIAIKRKLAHAYESLRKYIQRREQTKRRRERIKDWEKSTQRVPRARVPTIDRGETDGDHRGCAFCESVRSWLTGQVARIAHAVRRLGRGTSALLSRTRGKLRIGAVEPRIADLERRFHRQTYPGSRTRRFELHLPRGLRGDVSMPLLMVLHGCRQDSTDIRNVSRFDAIADREGFAVVYPFVTGYSGMRIRNCWGWWLDGEIRPGAGEVEDLWQIIEQLRDEIRVDDRRIHIAGLSSGGGMAVAAMVAHADKFASGAAVAGLAYSETPRAVAYAAPTGVEFKSTELIVDSMKSVLGENGRPSPLLIVHSHDDPVVNIQAARNLRDSWARCFDIDSTRPASETTGTTGGAFWVHARYREARRRSAIETFFIEGRGHGWYGGNPGKFSYPAAPDISELMWRFFKRHPLQSTILGQDKRRQMRQAS